MISKGLRFRATGWTQRLFPRSQALTDYRSSPKRSPAVGEKDAPPLLYRWRTIMVSNSKILSAHQTRCDGKACGTHRKDLNKPRSVWAVREQRRENVKALRDLGERIWLHLCPIKQLAGSMGMPNIYLYLVASLHLSAYGFMTSKLFGKEGEKKGASRQSRWLITKADRDGRQTHTRIRTWIDVETRFGDGEQRSRNLTHSLWQ